MFDREVVDKRRPAVVLQLDVHDHGVIVVLGKTGARLRQGSHSVALETKDRRDTRDERADGRAVIEHEDPLPATATLTRPAG